MHVGWTVAAAALFAPAQAVALFGSLQPSPDSGHGGRGAVNSRVAPGARATKTSATKRAPFSVFFTSTPRASTTSPSAKIAWTQRGASQIRCARDQRSSISCSSPRLYGGLAPGAHVFNVTATRNGASRVISTAWTVVPTRLTVSSTHSTRASTGSTGTSTGATTPSTTSAPPAAVASPVAPSGYSVPSGATVVSNSAQLVAALAAGPRAIVLNDGTYDSASYFNDANSSSLYAAHLGGAVLTAGLTVGGNWGAGGAVVQGLSFNIADPAKTFNGGEVYVWAASGDRTQVLDCTFEGNWTVPVGLLAPDPNGLVAQRLVFKHFTDEGIRASDNVTVGYGAATAVINSISDIFVDGVSYTSPGSSNGTAEAGLFIGQPVANGVHRIKIRNVAWAGIETVNNAWDTSYTDLDIDMSGPHALNGVAVYMEHYSRNLVFDGFQITGSMTGFNGEWDNGTAGDAAAHNVTIENGTIDAAGWTAPGHTSGIYLDEGTDSTTITGVTFKNQNWAAIGAFKNVGTNQINNNTYQLVPGAVPLSTNHI